MGRVSKNIPNQLMRYTARQLLQLLKHGRPVFDKDGQPVLNERGEQMYVPPSAAEMRVALDLCRQHDVRLPEEGDYRSSIEKTLDEWRMKQRMGEANEALTRKGAP